MKVLIADDSPVIRTAVESLLTEAGIDVVSAEDGLEAIQVFYAEHPDVVLMDLQMPRMNGYMACRVIKEDMSAAHTPVLILTAYDNAEDRYWADKSGADAFLTKESLGDELLSAIRSAVATKALSQLSGAEQAAQTLDQVDVLERVCHILDRKLLEMTIVNDIVTVGTRALDLRVTMREVLQLVRRFAEYDVAALTLVPIRVMTVRGDTPMAIADFDQFRSISAGHVRQLAGSNTAAEELAIWWLDGDKPYDRESHDEAWPSFHAMPLRSRGEVLAVLSLAHQSSGVFTPEYVRNLRMAEHPLATVIEATLHQHRVLEQEARLSLSSLVERGAAS